ncbi:MAG: glycoside hydrolase family 2 [Propionibacteriaceae bacterium]|nr:glycoside hydrolase family 2 [Propionibacteriaceae bacterium]
MTGGHPRPQLTRPGFEILDGDWGFRSDPDDAGLAEGWCRQEVGFDRTIRVPFPPESVASGIGQEVAGPIWYRRVIQLEPLPGRRTLLHFEGVDHRATVWLNGRQVAEHEGSQARFSLDVTDAARDGANVLVVRAVDDPGDLEQPRGKQDWQADPHVIWYRRTSGIWRTVWTESVPASWIDQVELRPQPDLRSVAFTARLAGEALAAPSVRVVLRLAEQILADVEIRPGSAEVRGTIVLDHECLGAEPEVLRWTPETPTVIDAEITLADGGGPIDIVGSYLGLRTVSVDRGRILLNGRPYFLRFVLEQAYWPQSHLAAPSQEALEQEVRLIKELGFNGLRMHQVSADPRFLECCDRLGLLVLADTAAAYRFSPTALRRTTDELMAVIARDRNHPSLIGWVPFNESWGLPELQTSRSQQHAVQAMYHLVKALDPSRIAFGNDGWHHVVGDVVGVHDYTQDPARLRQRYGTPDAIAGTLCWEQPAGRPLVLRPDPLPWPPASFAPSPDTLPPSWGARPSRDTLSSAGSLSSADSLPSPGTLASAGSLPSPGSLPSFPDPLPSSPRRRGSPDARPPVVLTEFGGISAHRDPEAWRGYGEVVAVDRLAEVVGALVAEVGPESGLAGFCYTQLTDTEQEKNGLLTEDREPKCSPAALRTSILGETGSRASHPAPTAEPHRNGEVADQRTAGLQR